jgi:DNA topoisomerase-1
VKAELPSVSPPSRGVGIPARLHRCELHGERRGEEARQAHACRTLHHVNLQQEASRKLGYGVDRTMRIAQGLYEQGHITYMRTDSVNLSEGPSLRPRPDQRAIRRALQQAAPLHQQEQGRTRSARSHPPADMMVRNAGADRDAERLYDLIWKRTLASQMADAELEKTVVDIAISTRPGKR